MLRAKRLMALVLVLVMVLTMASFPVSAADLVPVPANLTLVSASEPQSGKGGDKIVDGNLTTYYATNGYLGSTQMASSPRSVKVDLGAVSTVAEIKIYWGGSAWGYLPAEAYNVYVSADDSTYDLAFSYEGILSEGATYGGKFVTEGGSLGAGAWRLTATETGLNIENVRYIKVEMLGWKYRAAIREIEVNVLVEPAEYTIKYVDEEGTEISDTEVKVAADGSTVNVTAIDIEGYEVVNEAVQSIVLSKEAVNEVTFIYRKLAAVDYTVNYVDEEGNAVADAVVKSSYETLTATEEALEFEGYELIGDATVSIVLDKDATNEITFTYKKLAAVDYTVNYVDEEGNPVVDAVVKSSYDTLTATETAVDVYGYELVSDKTVSLVLDATVDNVIEFIYKKLPDVEYTVKFVDVAGNEMLPSKTSTGVFSYEVTEVATYIKGYYRPAPITITLAESDNVIEFVYEVIPERMVNSAESVLVNATVTTTGHDNNKNTKPEHLIDNDNATFSQANWTKNPNYTAIIDLHGNYDIDNISLLWCGGTTNKWDTTNGGTRATKYTIAVSVDGTEYTTVYTYDNATRTESRDNITVSELAATPKGVRYVKINFTEAYLSGRTTLYEVDVNGYATCDRVMDIPEVELYADGASAFRLPTFTVMTLDNVDPIATFAPENWALDNCTVEVTTKDVSDPASIYYTWEIDVKVIPTDATASVSVNLDLPDSYMMTGGLNYTFAPSDKLFDPAIAAGQNAIEISKYNLVLNYNDDGTLTEESAKVENRALTMAIQVQSIIPDGLPYMGYDDVVIEIKEFKSKGDRARFYFDEFVRSGDYYFASLLVTKSGVDQLEAVIAIYGVGADGTKVELDTRTITSNIITIDAKYPAVKTKAQTVKDYTFPMDVIDQLIEKVHPADLPTYTDDEWAFYEEILVARGWKAENAKTEIERVRKALEDEIAAYYDDPNWVPTKEYAEDTVSIINGYYKSNSSDYQRVIRMGTEVWNLMTSLHVESFSVYGPVDRPTGKALQTGFENDVVDVYLTFREGIDYQYGEKWNTNNGFCIRTKLVGASAEYANVTLGTAYNSVRRALNNDQLSPILVRLDWYNWGKNPFEGGVITVTVTDDWAENYGLYNLETYHMSGYKYSEDNDATLELMEDGVCITNPAVKEVSIVIEGAQKMYDTYVIVGTDKIPSDEPEVNGTYFDVE